jgi:arylsulfatase A-like enzyme
MTIDQLVKPRSSGSRSARRPLAAALLALVVTALPACAERRPNILLVSIDSLRADHLEAYGYHRETSPLVAWLARTGALFETVVAPAPWTLPSHVSLLTSMAPRQHGVTDAATRLADGAMTLARVLEQNGYATAGFVSTILLTERYGLAQGFDSYDAQVVFAEDAYMSPRAITSERLVDAVLGWLDGWRDGASGTPFFIFLHMYDVHANYNPPPPYDRLFVPPPADAATDPKQCRVAHQLALYDGEIRYTTEQLARVIDRLRALEILDDTIVVVTADHGDEFFEHGGQGHGVRVYDEIILVPLVVRYPSRVPADQRIASQVRLMDVAPTILGLAGIAPPASFGGPPDSPHRQRDLSPWITGATLEPFPALVAFSEAEMIPGVLPLSWSVRTQDRKLLQRPLGQQPELYDLSADPREQVDRAREAPEERDGLLGIRDQWRASPENTGSAAAPLALDDETKERLRALGYLR